MKIFIAGHRGMVGSAILRQLATQQGIEPVTRTRVELDLLDAHAVENFFAEQRPQQVYLAAAKVGGIWANEHLPAEFIYQNLMVQAHVIHAAWRHGVERLLFLGSSCIYPRLAPQPMPENALLTGPLEPTNEPYAVAKIAGIKLCESYNRQYGTDFRSAMPTNLYGPGDNFNLRESHVIPALLRKFHQAKLEQAPEVEVWGSGQAQREFLHVDDMADACVHLMNLPPEQYASLTDPMCSHVNVGSGSDLPIRELAETIGKVTGYQGQIRFDESQPDGPPRKLLDVSRLQSLGWQARIGLEEGLAQTYQWFLDHQHQLRA
ncbi:GDP-L-fucose synthase [Thiorhodovibrio frisius]|uniref:GDP-L-fucose synthase n=1 Tax=Thiorhodovibrio frisius TaxID=631362 RepID=H8YZX7_9GAMM|nr:GDP-L-fucose synthase [Thiorhodovibrio frisius]EIC22254.1 nucleoside-diphosphate-sugar epimerase [Thiorhodovibrio frisius]WPL24549.1 GDP-L-fucose synthase [Thiorhodovibrio frisius]